MPRKGENIFKRKDGRWEGRYIKFHENGKAIYGYVFGRSYSEAKKKKLEAIKLFSQKEKEAQKKILQPFMRDVAVQWLKELTVIRRKSTIIKYKTQLQNYIIPFFGNKRLNDISNENIIIFCNNLLTGDANGFKKLSCKSVSEILSRMKSIRKFALLHGYEVKYVPDCVKIPNQINKIRVLTFEEEKTLIEYLSENLNLTTLGILLSLFTGIRLGELCALKWNDFSLKKHEVHICRTMQRLKNLEETAENKTYIEIGEPKSQFSIRTIPIPENIINFLKSSYVEGAYLLSGDKNYFIEPRTMENRFKQILKKCKIENVNFHSLRHTFATRCIEVGFDIKSLSEILGHANVNITLNRYVHPTMKTKHENMNKLSELFAVK